MRECLNYGHTLGHAVEACAGYGTFSHGACVAEGMRFAAFMAERGALGTDAGTGGAELAELAAAQAELLDALGLGRLRYGVSADELLSAMKRDKKARGGQLRFVLARDVADWEVVVISVDEALRHLKTWVGESA